MRTLHFRTPYSSKDSWDCLDWWCFGGDSKELLGPKQDQEQDQCWEGTWVYTWPMDNRWQTRLVAAVLDPESFVPSVQLGG